MSKRFCGAALSLVEEIDDLAGLEITSARLPELALSRFLKD